ncbi:MAG: hypothetical protein U5L45_18345 [Saprospiraceae bacterium]|nr:hypothetical protein [Saprospiraceae bacterium]
MVRFSGFARKTNHSPRARSEREMQKTLLGYAHSSITWFKKLSCRVIKFQISRPLSIYRLKFEI